MIKLRAYVAVLLMAIAIGGCSGVEKKLQQGEPITSCVQTEQEGCIELDLLNIAWDPDNPGLKGLDRPPANQTERAHRVTQLGRKLYDGWKADSFKAADPQTYTVYIWDPAKYVSVSLMNQYRPIGKDGANVTRHPVEEVSTDSFQAAFDPSNDLGKPDRAFRVTATSGVVAFQVPWEFIGTRTYVLICGSDRNIYPNRQTANEGQWITPEYLNYMRGNGAEYALIPFVSAATFQP